VACPVLRAATGLLLMGTLILMPIPSIGLEIMTISLPVLLELSGAGPSVFITLQLLPVVTLGPLVLSHILTACSHVSVVLPKIAAVSLKVLPILADIPPVLSHILMILAGIPVRGAGLCIGGTAIHKCRQHRDYK